MLNTPDPSYHGAVWTEAVKPVCAENQNPDVMVMEAAEDRV